MKIVYWPSSVLRSVSATVTETPDPALIADMKSTMKAKNGLGLSAVQVGVLKRIVVTESRTFVNPVIKEFRGEAKSVPEGCLSLPGFIGNVRRYPEVVVAYQDENMVYLESLFDGQLAHILQHELEHLDGKLFIDKLPSAQRASVMGNMQKLRRAGRLR